MTWSCTGDPCPWGAQLTGNAAVWPDGITSRYGYTTSAGIYLPAIAAHGTTITITDGNAAVYAGPTDTSHSRLAQLSTGDSYTITNLPDSHVVSVQNDNNTFAYTLTDGGEPTPTPT
ncbi:hypothetical protein MWU57_17920, partial [Isoptericola sp. S6320L]|uniref:hypothetical protein n=1 Tax=Isoptericola sp. S6320L TaxID=2926411 RepID=UPI001FF67672